MAKAAQRNVYLYYFAHVVPSPAGKALGAFHTGEIPFVFGSDPGWPNGPHDPELKNTISGYWVQFAATGNPNRRGLPQWPRYEPASDRYLELGDTIRVGSRLRQRQYDLLDDAQAALDARLRH
jgi:para-nitrobenzyl esterase